MTTRTIRGVHVFWSIAAFFAAMIAIEAFFVVRAVTTFPGEDVPNSYMLGLDYNHTLAQRAEQGRLGWKAEAGIEGRSTLVVRMLDAEGLPLGRLNVSARVHSVGTSADAAIVDLTAGQPGEYSAPVRETGRIRIVIEARRLGDEAPVFEAEKTLVTR